MTIESQEKEIKNYLVNGGKLTALDALSLFGCLRLSARIFDLKDRGLNIQDKFITVSSGKRVKEYYIEKQ